MISCRALSKRNALLENVFHERRRKATLKIIGCPRDDLERNFAPCGQQRFGGGIIQITFEGAVFLGDDDQNVIIRKRFFIAASTGAKQNDFIESPSQRSDVLEKFAKGRIG